MKMKLMEIAKVLDVEVRGFRNDCDISGVCRDSRQVKNGDLYIPLKGDRVDGHSFIENVINSGCEATLWSDKIATPSNIACVMVSDVLEALQKLASYYLKKIGAKVVGITGSNGKTSSKDMCYSVLSEQYRCSKTIGNYNNDIGLPLSILSSDESTEIMILEMGMDRLGDINRLVQIAPLDLAIILNIGTAHLEFLGSRENIAMAKLEILDGLKPNGLLIRPKDEKLLCNKYKNEMTFGNGETCNIYPTRLEQKLGELHFDTNIIKDIALRTFGFVQVENAMAVILVGKYFGLDDNKIRAGLYNTEFTKKRNDLYKLGNNYIYDDSYKSNPEALYKCFETMNSFDIRRVAIISDMAELGDNEINIHREVAKELEKWNIDKVYIYGKLSHHTYESCISLGVNAEFFENKFDIAKKLLDESNAMLLFKGSNCMRVFDVLERYKELLNANK